MINQSLPGNATCFIERSKVREILISSDVIDNDSTDVLLVEVDALPVFTASDFTVPAAGMREALERISKQHQTDEMSEEEIDNGDFENAYDIIISIARAALALPSTEREGPKP